MKTTRIIYQKIIIFLPENFQFLEVKFSIYLNRRVFVMLFQHVVLWEGGQGSVSVVGRVVWATIDHYSP